MGCVFPAATLIDLPLQFEDMLLACINMLCTTDYWLYVIQYHFMQMFQSDISYLAMVWNDWYGTVLLQAFLCQKKITVAWNAIITQICVSCRDREIIIF